MGCSAGWVAEAMDMANDSMDMARKYAEEMGTPKEESLKYIIDGTLDKDIRAMGVSPKMLDLVKSFIASTEESRLKLIASKKKKI